MGLLAGCCTRPSSSIKDEISRKIGSSDLSSLPEILDYADLVKIWGPAVFTYAHLQIYLTEIEGIVLAVLITYSEHSPTKLPRQEVIGMYFTDMKDFKLHAWGRDAWNESPIRTNKK